jgi:hypothetical protein
LLLCLGNSLIPFSAQTRDWSRSSSSLFIAGVGAARARRLAGNLRETAADTAAEYLGEDLIRLVSSMELCNHPSTVPHRCRTQPSGHGW